MTQGAPRIPLRLKLAVTLALATWAPVYWAAYGPRNFLWFCDLANFLIVLAFWLESSLLLSSQAVGVLLVQILWAVDVGGRLVLGFHLIGGTEYMFDPAKPLALRLFSLFHLLVPPLLLWGLRRLGYHHRGLELQTALAVIVLPLSFLFGPEANLNWTWGPFAKVQHLLPPLAYFALCLPGYLLILYLPTHLALCRLDRAWRRGAGER